jgi:hypothetical protein
MIINADSFIAADIQPENSLHLVDWKVGTVEVNLRGQSQRVRAIWYGGLVTAFGMVGRYKTGTKAWPARVSMMRDQRTNDIFEIVHFGRDDRSGNFYKLNALWFA